MLSDHQALVQTATSAAEALQFMEWYKPDVLVSDLVMPEEDGYSLIAKLRAMENLKHVPAVALTAYVRVRRSPRMHVGWIQYVCAKPRRALRVNRSHREPGEPGIGQFKV